MANEWKDIGREVRDVVLDAVNSGDYSQLNRKITSSVGAAIDEVNARLNGRKQTSNRAYRKSAPKYQNPYFQNTTPNSDHQALQVYAKKPKGSVSSILLQVFGWILLAIFGFAIFSVSLFGLYTGWDAEYNLLNGLMLPFAIGGGAMIAVGAKQRSVIQRFRKYLVTIRGRNYCAISELARKIGKKESYVRQDLQKMIANNWFCQAHIDDEGKTLLLTDAMYQQYRMLKEERNQQAEETRRRETEPADETLYRETEEQGRAYIAAIRHANDEIPGEVVSQKLYRLEEIVSRIFAQVREQPQQIPELRRFFDYYMPTTLKLVETYRMLDGQSIAGQNIQTAKQEIEQTLDTINLAFENLFDSLFAHTAVDITSDIAVLKNLLRQEGLTEKDFKS